MDIKQAFSKRREYDCRVVEGRELKFDKWNPQLSIHFHAQNFMISQMMIMLCIREMRQEKVNIQSWTDSWTLPQNHSGKIYINFVCIHN